MKQPDGTGGHALAAGLKHRSGQGARRGERGDHIATEVGAAREVAVSMTVEDTSSRNSSFLSTVAAATVFFAATSAAATANLPAVLPTIAAKAAAGRTICSNRSGRIISRNRSSRRHNRTCSNLGTSNNSRHSRRS